MSQTIDTNLLVYASNDSDPLCRAARELVSALAAGPEIVLLFWPVLMGYLRIATHPSIFPSPLTPSEAEQNVNAAHPVPRQSCRRDRWATG